MSTEKVEIVATARDQASATIKKLNANVTALGNKGRGPLGGLLSGLGGISPVSMIAAVGVGALTAALTDGIAGALAEDKQLARLGATLKANIPNWDGSTAAIDRATTAAMDLSFSDDDARESMIRLITGTKDVTASVKDMQLAMNIARGANIDLASATDVVLKASIGNTRALKAYGIEVKAGSTPLQIMTELQQRFAGQAEAYANTTAGKFESAQVKVDDALEGFGHGLINAAAGFMSYDDAMKGNTQSMSDWLHAAGFVMPLLNGFADQFDHLIQPDARTKVAKSVLDQVFLIRDTIRTAYADAAATRTDAEWGAGFAGLNDAMKKEAYFAQLYGKDAGKAYADNFSAMTDRLSDNLVDSLKGTKDVLKQAKHDMAWALNHPHALQNKLEKIQVALDSDSLQKLLNSKNPQQQLIGRQIQAVLEGQASSLTGTEYQSGVTSIVGAINSLKGYLHFPSYPSSRTPTPVPTQSGTNVDGFIFHRDAPYNPPHYAKGGYLGAGRWGMVGENGPEFIRAGRQGATIAPNTGGHGHAIVLNGRLVGQAMDEYLGRQMSLMPTGVVSRG